MITAVCLCLWTFHTFHGTGRNSSWILTKLGMMVGYGSGMMPIVGRSGPVITAVPVHWFQPKKWCFSILFALEAAIQVVSQPNLVCLMTKGQ